MCFIARGTGYYPDASALEGGFTDREGNPLCTLQDFLDGKAIYVSCAMDTKAFPYATRLAILELDAHFGQDIDFRVVDTGDAFIGKGTSRIDICCADKEQSELDVINGWLTVNVVKEP